MDKNKKLFRLYKEYKIQGFTEDQLRILCRKYDRQIKAEFIRKLEGKSA